MSSQDHPGWQPSPFSSGILIGNWNEDKFDVKQLSQPHSLPSPHDHHFQTTYKQAYSRSQPRVPKVLKYPEGKEHSVFPGHQSVLDPPGLKAEYNSFTTTSMEAYTTINHPSKQPKAAVLEPEVHQSAVGHD